MERDRALWQSCEADPGYGVRLRVYGWSPPALSLGFHQPADSVDHHELARRGFDLVRRPTGGAAVLHADEITYAVVARLGAPGLGRGVIEIHGAIAEALAATFHGLGIDVEFGGGGVPQEFACFSGAGGHEMTLAGRKLVGSALRRGREAFLQHGSVMTGEGHLDLTSFIAGSDEAGRRAARDALASKTCCVPGLDAAEFASRLGGELAARCGLDSRRVDSFEGLLAT